MPQTFATVIPLLVASILPPFTTAKADELRVGSTAPEFSLVGSDGKTYKLSNFKDKKHVVVAWFPKAFTGG